MARWVKNPTCNAGDTGDVGSIPGSGRSLEEGNGNPLRYFSLGNPRDRGACWGTVHGVPESIPVLFPGESNGQRSLVGRVHGMPESE